MLASPFCEIAVTIGSPSIYGIKFPVLVPQLLETIVSVYIFQKAVFHFILTMNLFPPLKVTASLNTKIVVLALLKSNKDVFF